MGDKIIDESMLIGTPPIPMIEDLSDEERKRRIAEFGKTPFRNVGIMQAPYRARDHKPAERLRFTVDRKSRREDADDGRGRSTRRTQTGKFKS